MHSSICEFMTFMRYLPVADSPDLRTPTYGTSSSSDVSNESLLEAPTLISSTTPKLQHHRRNVALCFTLHAGLVCIHMALWIVLSRHYERALTWDLTTFSKTLLPLIVTTASQTFGTVRPFSIFFENITKQYFGRYISRFLS